MYIKAAVHLPGLPVSAVTHLLLLSSLLIIVLMVKKFVYKEGNCCYAKANGC